jgi:hypothetical protein
MPKRADLMNHRFGRLLVVADAGVHWNRPTVAEALWLCRCDCGNEIKAKTSRLRRGRLLSCGCLRVRHGHNHRGQRTKTYRAWVNMRSRCDNPKVNCYKDYGGRGIKYCERWSTFANFLADLGECPPDRMLERRDNSGNYEPANCLWATPVEQANNKRNTRYVTFRGEEMSIARLAKISGLAYPVVQQRISKYGWTPEQAATLPLGSKL